MTTVSPPRSVVVRIGRAVGIAAVLLSLGGLAAGFAVSAESGSGLDVMLDEFVPALAAIGIGFGVLGWLVVPREPENRVVWVYLICALLSSTFVAGEAVIMVGVRAGGWPLTTAAINELRPIDVGFLPATAEMLASAAVSPGLFWLLSIGVLMFPDGRLPTPRWRWVVWLSVASALATSAILVYFEVPWGHRTYGAVESYDNLVGVPLIGLVLALVASWVGLLTRFRRSTGVQRQQIRWILFGTSLIIPALGYAVLSDTADPSLIALIDLVALLVYMGCFWVALTRYRLYDIDVVISRSIVFGVLAAFITAVYALVVVGVGSWVGAGTSSLPLSIGATAMVAVAFEPVRSRIQRFANRLVYGARATPYQVLADLTSRLASAESTEGILERMVQRLTEGTGATRAILRLDGQDAPAAVWPPDASSEPDAHEFTVPIRTADAVLGSVSVLKGRGEELTPTEQALVGDLAGSAGMVLNKVRLDADLAKRADDLRDSRRRMLDAQGEERRRLERDLHDGAQQQIVALKVKLGLAARFAEEEGSDDSVTMIRQMADDAQEAIEEIRSLAKGIFPPLLEDEGLRAALAAGAANAPTPVIVTADGLRRFPSDVEAAVYFCITEAITNAVKHSEANRIEVELDERDGGLGFTVSDDGTGFAVGGASQGSGLVGMRDRLEAIGGSLSVESAPGSGATIEGFVPSAPVA